MRLVKVRDIESARAREREERKSRHTPVGQGSFAESAPALSTIDKIDVGHEQRGQQVLRNHHTNRRTNKPPSQMPDKEPIQKHIDRRRNQQNIRSRLEQTLCLHKPLATLKDDKSRHAEQVDFQIGACELGGAVFGDHEGENFGGVSPEDDEGQEEEEEEGDHALDLEADEVFVAGAVGLGAEGVEGGC